jgi:hypothetical protein
VGSIGVAQTYMPHPNPVEPLGPVRGTGPSTPKGEGLELHRDGSDVVPTPTPPTPVGGGPAPSPPEGGEGSLVDAQKDAGGVY